jgi:DNA-binding NarL/FixJ family response regulator
MTRVYLADGKHSERSALRLLLNDLNFEVIGEAADWATLAQEVPTRSTEILLVDFSLLPRGSATALAALRLACSSPILVILLSPLDARQQAALSAGADAFISKNETPQRLAEHLHSVARNQS